MDAHADTWRPSGLALGLMGAATIVITVAAAALQLQMVAILTLVAVTAVVFAVLSHRLLLRWEIQVSLIVLTILWIPLGRYSLPGGLPFNLEPYRVLVAAVALGWCVTLLSDSSLRWKRIGLFGPLLAVSLAVVASDALNTARIDQYDILPEVIKSLSLFASYLVVVLLVSSVIARREQLDIVIKVLVAGGAVVAVFALIQYRAGFNVFDHLGGLPLLNTETHGIPTSIEQRAGASRVYASAEHPIALSAALVMLLPLGIYVGRRWGTWSWWTATALIGVASFATVARTGSTMLLTVLVVFILLKPRDMLRLWKWAIPFLITVHILSPGALGGLKSAFFPEQGLITQQQTAYSEGSSNRLADLAPGLHEWWRQPYLGVGFGTRITDSNDPNSNAPILDDQWLGLLLEVGLGGALAILWLFARSFRRLAIAARGDPSPHSWLLVAIAAAIAAFAVGMITFDVFAFGQATFLLFILIGLSVPALRLARTPDGGPV